MYTGTDCGTVPASFQTCRVLQSVGQAVRPDGLNRCQAGKPDLTVGRASRRFAPPVMAFINGTCPTGLPMTSTLYSAWIPSPACWPRGHSPVWTAARRPARRRCSR